MNKYQEALDRQKNNVKKLRDKEFVEYRDDFQTLQELVDKHEELEQENFDLRNKLNTEEECCAMLKKKVKTQAEIITSLAQALEDNEIDLSYLIFSYLTPNEWLYIRELLPYSRSDTDK